MVVLCGVEGEFADGFAVLVDDLDVQVRDEDGDLWASRVPTDRLGVGIMAH